MKKIERAFERLLWNSRVLVLIAVIASLLGSVVLFVVGTLDMVTMTYKAVSHYLGRGGQSIHEFIVTDTIIAVDIFLVAVVLLMFGAGLYRLFISQLLDRTKAVSVILSTFKHSMN